MIEYNSAITNPDGLDVEDVKRHMTEHGTLLNYPNATAATDSPTDFMTNECDILIPAATEKSIH